MDPGLVASSCPLVGLGWWCLEGPELREIPTRRALAGGCFRFGENLSSSSSVVLFAVGGDQRFALVGEDKVVPLTAVHGVVGVAVLHEDEVVTLSGGDGVGVFVGGGETLIIIDLVGGVVAQDHVVAAAADDKGDDVAFPVHGARALVVEH